MADILFVKTSSLGDVIHHMPAVTDARRKRPDARFAWVVEEAYAPLVRLHPGIAEVIPVASRRWRKAVFTPSTWSEIAQFRRALRARRYDDVIDAQGLFRSALITRAAQGRRHGFDRASVRERPAAALYDVRHCVPRELHAVDRNRRLTALSLRYELDGEADYGLVRSALVSPAGPPYAIFLHATARPEKEWPEDSWIALGLALRRRLRVLLPWGDAEERARSERIAAAVPGAEVAQRRPLDEVARLIAGASLVVGVDTGLLHLAAALSVPSVALFSATEPRLTGPIGRGALAILDGRGRPPELAEVRHAAESILG